MSIPHLIRHSHFFDPDEYECSRCGAVFKDKLTKCPNCGANLQEVVMHTAMDEEVPESTYGNGGGMSPRSKKWLIIILIIFFGAPITNYLIFLPLQAIGLLSNQVQKNVEKTNRTSITTVVEENEDRSIYIDEIGRTCYWDSESENYYDAKTDCYFWYNREIDPPQWQYWYEGISSDYGDYGWMEYDASEDKWYIEESNENWVELPDSYDTSYLWHTESVED